ncbi:f5/8 type C domain-containing protein [Ditylenchus destructor]|nr:f5/8 type C domain-containing protein [Ditylenchus destructor]
MNALLTPCLDYIDNYAAEILTSQSFIQLPMALVQQLISRNSFCAPEIDIFSAIARWIEAHPEELDHFEDVLSNIRLPLIKLDDLLNIVRPSSLIEADKLLDAISEQSKKRTSDLVYRGILCPMINVAEPSMNAKVLTGEYPTALLMSRKGFTQDYDRKFTRHAITTDDPGITIELGRSFIINHIKLWLPDREQRNQTYSYYVEVSMDQKDWVRVIDHTQYLCRSVQNLFFRERVVKYVRIVGTYNSLHGTFNLMGFEAFYTTQSFEVDPTTTLLIPRHNVATETPGCATVIEGVSKSRNVLLDGNTDNYDWDDGYTCHQLGSGAITIQFPQPYMLNSLRLLLWDCDERTYSFYIEASCDQVQWTKIVDANRLRSWQTFTFKRIPVVFIRIVGTANSANEVFHLVHFETPAQVKEMDRSILHLDRNDACSTSRDEHRSQTRSPNAIDIQPDPVVEDNLIVQPIDALEMREDDEEVANEAEEVNVNEE